VFSLAVAALPPLLVFSTAFAQSAGGGPVRTVLALGRVSTMVAAPMYLKLQRVAIPPGATALYRGDQSTLYVLSGAAAVTNASDKRTLGEGEGVHVAADADVQVQSNGSVPLVMLQYQLSPAANLGNAAWDSRASATELQRMAIPAASLRAGPYEFSMTRVTSPAGAPRPRPHTRSGAALYYVLAEGTITIWPSATTEALSGESRTEPRPAGAIQQEPNGFIHSWQSKPGSALVLLQANVSPEGVAEIIFVK
jgi:mannose-6-phosphate isomerase-like protein (cupin superfamily)